MRLSRTLLCAVLVILPWANANAATGQVDDPARINLTNCSDEGGWAGVHFEDGEPVLWTLSLFGSHRRMEGSVTRRDNSALDVQVTHTYRDESQISYRLDVRDEAGRWVAQSMLVIDFSEIIASELNTLRYLYDGAISAAAAGESDFSCTSGG